MPIIYLEDYVSVETFEKTCCHHSLKPQKVVFLFPGNSGHHVSSATLFSIKTGSGLAVPAGHLGRKGYPVLSLPTTSMEAWSTSKTQQKIVEGAIADLYRAIGAGFSVMLPTRYHSNNDYFEQGLKATQGNQEPNFWGGIQKAANKPLAQHYIKALDNLAEFIALSEEQRMDFASKDSLNPYYAAYLAGRQMLASDPWLQSKTQVSTSRVTASPKRLVTPLITVPTTRPVLSKPKTQRLPIPASYEKIYQTGSTALQSARALLDDYTKGNSALLRFFTGHWNRHHVSQVAPLVLQIDRGELTETGVLLKQLKNISLENPEGSLARRIQFIEEKLKGETNLNVFTF